MVVVQSTGDDLTCRGVWLLGDAMEMGLCFLLLDLFPAALPNAWCTEIGSAEEVDKEEEEGDFRDRFRLLADISDWRAISG